MDHFDGSIWTILMDQIDKLIGQLDNLMDQIDKLTDQYGQN